MQARKLAYTIGYIHILTFKDHIRKIIAPYFSYDLEYAVDHEGTLKENIRLVFKRDGFVLQFNKEMSTLLYEGPIADVKKNNVHIDMFFDIVESIKKMDSFVKVKYHHMEIDFVEFLGDSEYAAMMKQNNFLKNPFGDMDEFAVHYEFKGQGNEYTLQFGNYQELDIAKRNLSPLKTEFNRELYDKKGRMAIYKVNEPTESPSFNKFKGLISDLEKTLEKFLA